MFKFLGMDVASDITQLKYSKNDAFFKLERPNTLVDIHILIEFLDYVAIFCPYVSWTFILNI